MSELLGCPFCGGEAVTKMWDNGYFRGHKVLCGNCGIEKGGTTSQTKEDVYAMWNTRSQPQPTGDVVERRIVQEEGRVFWIYKDGSHRCVTDADCMAINAALPQQPSLPQCNPPETCVTLADYNTMENERNYHMAMEQSLFERVKALESMLSLPQGVTKQNTARIELPGIRQVGEPSDSSAATSASRTGLPNNCEGSAPTLSEEEAVEIILEAWEMRQKKLSPLTRWLAEDAYRALAKRLGWM